MNKYMANVTNKFGDIYNQQEKSIENFEKQQEKGR